MANIRVKSCCCFIPLRIGILIIAYFNVLLSWLVAVGMVFVSYTSYKPTPMAEQLEVVLAAINVATTTHLGFCVVLVCGMHRNDSALLRIYYWYSIVAFGLTILAYSLVIPESSLKEIFMIVVHFAYQAYVIILVKSAIFEIRQNQLDINKSRENISVTDVEKSDATGL